MINIKLKKNILLIEDEHTIGKMYKLLLEVEQYQVTVALTGTVGINYAQCFKYDLIITDIGLPDIDGIEVVREIIGNTINKNTPIIAITAFANWQISNCFKSSNIVKIMTKPCEYQELLNCVTKNVIAHSV